MTSLIKFKPRNMRFSLAGADKRNWFGGDPVATAVMDGASILFPVAESFFIASVNHFRDRVTDPAQMEDVRVFQTQEATHTREHRRYNKAIEAFGGDTGALDARLQADMSRPAVKNASPEYRLALTCAFEHFTGMLAEYLLERPEFLEKADPEFARIWRWHAIEETEHKSVCFDVWNLVKPKGLAGYLMRTRALLAATRIL
ncbi:MAG: metal-dependent hydrolase, partial [Zavarzinia sp.]|nr:metal-dependent hydrolase [Zavarzinia sp.]